MDWLDRLAQTALETIASGYYDHVRPSALADRPRRSLVQAIHNRGEAGRLAIIAEIKPASPSGGSLRVSTDTAKLARQLGTAGAAGLSVLTEPVYFRGSLQNLREAGRSGRPTLMKDFLLAPVQLDAASAYGASATLLILTLFNRGYAQLGLAEMIGAAHDRGLEVLLEVNSPEEYRQAQETQAEMIGINNRELASLQVDLGRTGAILAQAQKDRPVWALSGIETREDIQRLSAAGADAFLVGSSLMRSADPAAKLAELIGG